jgi:hypothetical protein
MPGPSKKSDRLKQIAGTLRADRIELAPNLVVDPLCECPNAPDWLPNAYAVQEWQRLAPILVANGMLTEANTWSLALICALRGRITQTINAGETPSGHVISQCRHLTNDLGLTSVASIRIKAPSAAPNRFERFRPQANKGGLQ